MSNNPLKINRFHVPEAGMYLDSRVEADFLDLPVSDREIAYSGLENKVHLTMLDNLQTLVVRGEGELEMTCHCDRCHSKYTEYLPVEDICHVIENCPDIIDLTEAIREDILLSFPQHYLCGDDCLGLCPGCGKNLNRENCSCSDYEESSSALDVLDGLKFEE